LNERINRLRAATRQRHGKEIDQGTLGLMPNLLRDVIPTRRGNEARKNLRHRRLVQHGSSRMGRQHPT
jgi:hypothetical protein